MRELLRRLFPNWFPPVTPTPTPEPEPEPEPVYDINVRQYTYTRVKISTLLFGFNFARAFSSMLKSAGQYFYENTAMKAVWDNGPFTLFRNGGTVTTGSRHVGYGNGYAISYGSVPAIFKDSNTAPSLDEFVSESELKSDQRETLNYHFRMQQAQTEMGYKVLYVANPYQNEQEIRDIIELFGKNNIVGIVAMNEPNSPKAFRLGIRANNLMEWAYNELYNVCKEYNIPLGVGAPPYEYRDRELKGEALNGKLLADKDFIEYLAANNYSYRGVEANLFDFVCFHPYAQVPDRDRASDTQWSYMNKLKAALPDDFNFVRVQIEHLEAVFNLGSPVKVFFAADEHGLEHPEFGHAQTGLSALWTFERFMSLIRLNADHDLRLSNLQIFLQKAIEGVPQSYFTSNENGGFNYGPEITCMDLFNVFTDNFELVELEVDTPNGITLLGLRQAGNVYVFWLNKEDQTKTLNVKGSTSYVAFTDFELFNQMGVPEVKTSTGFVTLPPYSVGRVKVDFS